MGPWGHKESDMTEQLSLISLEVGEDQFSDFVLQNHVGYPGSFASPQKLWNHFVDMHKTTCWGFD